MFESITSYIPKLQGEPYGEWFIDRQNDGSPEHPIQLPFVNYSRAVYELEDVLYNFRQLIDRCYM